MTAEVGAQAVSNILYPSAKLGLDIDSLQPGTAARFTNRFLLLMNVPTIAKQPNAQEVASLFWALATVQHMAADDACAHFSSLPKHPDAHNRPTAEGTTNMLWALATMEHVPGDGAFRPVLQALQAVDEHLSSGQSAQCLGHCQHAVGSCQISACATVIGCIVQAPVSRMPVPIWSTVYTVWGLQPSLLFPSWSNSVSSTSVLLTRPQSGSCTSKV